MTAPLTLTTGQRPDGTALLTATGEIDMSNSEKFAAAIDTALGGADGHLVVDLSAVEYLDSAGLSILFAHAERLEVIAPPLLEPVLTLSGLADLTTIKTTPPPASH
ncbi:STAS domain-containing protein [Actinomadura decatromicini]|uniref:STAS domain-containing protein n=1 Tax=Actinomadura decatromicini TaxID=2604572 RepID=A0A5D3FYP5_9ACTN|nr:STAS domain-containing protein [Actinomadura decatromicini]TYK53139.1 STAS domain-containing protein [Actinomadura decatromicini]